MRGGLLEVAKRDEVNSGIALDGDEGVAFNFAGLE